MALDQDQIEDVLARFAAGETMTSALARYGLDWTQWSKLSQKDRELNERWHAARKDGCHAVMEQIRDLSADNSHTGDGATSARVQDPARLRIALDALKFYVSRVHREAYGDSVDLNVRGTLDMRAILSAADARVLRYQRAELDVSDAELVPAPVLGARLQLADLL